MFGLTIITWLGTNGPSIMYMVAAAGKCPTAAGNKGTLFITRHCSSQDNLFPLLTKSISKTENAKRLVKLV